VDAPITYGMPRDEFDAFMQEEHGRQYMENDHAERMARADKYETSAMSREPSLARIIRSNRAGPNETELTLEEIVAKYGQVPEDDETPDV
jgi:hypothetical protein